MASHLENNSYGVAIIAVGFVLLVVGAVALVMRFWSRRLKGQRFQLNDWFAVGAWVWNAAFVSHTTQAILSYGLGQHASVIGSHNIGQVLKSLFGIKPEWAFGNAFVKLSILHLYVVIFPQRWLKMCAYSIMILAVLYSVAAFLEIFFSCFPMAYMWNPEGQPGGYCINLSKAWVAVGLTNLIEDIMIVFLPLPILFGLHIDLKRKIGIITIFSVGLFIIIVSGIRIKVILDFDQNDVSGGLGPIAFWSMMEPFLGLINCCLPVIQPAISKLSGDRLWSTQDKQSRGNSGAWAGSSSRKYRNRIGSENDEDMYPLSSVDDLGTKKPTGRTDIMSVQPNEMESGERDLTPPPNRIVVETEWDVSSTR